MTSLSRRRLLSAALAAAALGGLPPLPAAPRPQRVAVVGAGLAGLVAAYELMRSGHEVTLYEARERCGGRIRTRHDAFGDGLYVEEGALEFGDGYTLVNHYAAEFGLATVNAAGPRGGLPTLYYVGGRRYPVTPGSEPDWPYALSPAERRLGIDGVWQRYLGPVQAKLAEPFEAHSLSRAARALDAANVNDYAHAQGASDAALLLLRRCALGEDLGHVSGLEDALWQRFLAGSHRWLRIEGGNERLAQAFATRLGTRLRCGCELQALLQERDSVRLTFLEAGKQQEVRAERVVLAVPFSVLRRIDSGASFARHKRQAIDSLRYESVTRIHVHTRQRFWRMAGFTGIARTDLPVGTVLEASAGQPGEGGIIAAESCGEASRKLAALTETERVNAAVENLERVLPGTGAAFSGAATVVWDQDPHARGGWAYYAPGEMESLFPFVAVPDGRVHFAGEHTQAVGHLEGAAQSGQRVAREIGGF
ncbi:MAG: FAD-dependent oxidoreductase [Proteobacteria bacterium]|nr:FAD-dependent oxidoreductase [Pseudomonadota bacterium]